MKIRYYGLGFYAVTVEDDYEPIEGDYIADRWLTDEELLLVIPGRAEYIEARDLAALKASVRLERDRQLKEVYDIGMQMVRRELETLPLDSVYEAKLINKRSELHSYARLLQAIPDQSGFPHTITWPAIPTEELS